MTTRLIIKGEVVAAIRAATEHGIEISRYRKHPTFLEIVADADDANGVVVRRWFGDPNQGAPYPVGTLLFFVENVEPLRDGEATDVQTITLPAKVTSGGYVIGARPREA